MSLVWRKIQRSHKKAAKYKFVCELQELTIHCGRKWQPQKVAVAWVHRRRRYVTKDHQWEPSITDPYRGIIMWPVEESECLEVVTTLYRDSRQDTFDDKEWTFIVEGVSPRGKRKALAGLSLNLRLFVNELPGTQTELQLKLKPMCEHVQSATMKVILSCQMLKEGSALDDDMQSVASAMSVSHHKADIADLAEVENLSPVGSSHSMSELARTSSPTTPEDSRPQALALETAAVASEIVETWRPLEKPKISPQPVQPPRFTRPLADSMEKQVEESRPATKPDVRPPVAIPRETTAKVAASKRISVPPKETSVELPSTGSDLLSWCQAATGGYSGVNIVDFSKCWRNGLAFCALIHRFRPELIGPFESLRSDDIRSNCKRAFDAAAVLGVPKLIDPEEMVIMVVPDKIAVTSYVYNLRATLTGDQQRHSLSSPWSSIMFHSDDGGAGRESTSTTSGSPAPDNRLESPAAVRTSTSTSVDENKPTMTRNELMNPFDDDADESSEGTLKTTRKRMELSTVATPSPAAPTALAHGLMELSQNRPTVLAPLHPSSAQDRQEDLKRRARMLLQQMQTDDKKLSNDTAMSPEEEKRRQELRDRARQLIEEAQRQPSNVVKISDVISSPNEELWPSRPRIGYSTSSSAPATRQTTPEHRQYIAKPLLTKEYLREAVQQDGGAFDRFKRFGSMRTQELTQSINFVASLYQKGLRSASVPKELQSQAHNGNKGGGAESHPPPAKSDDALERDTRSRDQILAEIEQLTQRQRILDQTAADVEKRWRKAMQDASGTELEQSLMNEYLGLLNERNMLTRRDMYLNILEKIREHEERFQGVQRQLGELMKVEESEKTELHKRQIDGLMEKLIEIVNRRDELVQQLMAHEQGTQEAAELAEMNYSLPMINEDQKNCVIQ